MAQQGGPGPPSRMQALRAAFRLGPYEDISFKLTPLSLNVFSKQNPLRKACIQAVNWRPFDWLMLMTITANCITLALDSNRPGFENTDMGQNLKITNYIFIAIFTLEAAMKIIALGFLFASNTYLRDGWNCLDFFVVLVSYLEFTSLGNVTAIRSIRVLRPLRTITKVPKMKLIVSTLIRSLPMLADVLVLAAFYFSIFGITGVQMYAGKLSGRCGAPVFDNAIQDPDSGAFSDVQYLVDGSQQEHVCSGPVSSTVVWSNSTGVPLAVSGIASISGRMCPWSSGPPDPSSTTPYGSFCTAWGNPGSGQRHFDNILNSWLAVFQIVTMTDWVYIMYDCQDAVSWWVWLLHLPMVIIGNFLIISLALAVLYLSFIKDREDMERASAEALERERLAAEADHRRLMRVETKVNKAAHVQLNTDTASDAAPGLIPAFASRSAHSALSVTGPGLDVGHKTAGGAVGEAHEHAAQTHTSPVTPAEEEHPPVPVHHVHPFRRKVRRMVKSRGFELFCSSVVIMNAVVMALTWYEMPETLDYATDVMNYIFTCYFGIEMLAKLIGLGIKGYCSEGMNLFDGVVTIEGLVEMALALSPSDGVLGSYMSVLRAFRLLRVFRLARSWTSLNRLIRVLLSSVVAVSWLTALLLLFIFIWALLGTQFFGYQLAECTAVQGSSQTCPPGMDVLDCPAIFECYVPCTADLLGTWFPVDGSPYGGQAFCEQFPANFVPGAEDNDPSWPVYLAQVGKPEQPNANYDNMFNSIITIFQILTLDNWADLLQLSMTRISPATALFYVGVIIIGCYMLLNLFLAILLDNLGQISEKTPASASDYGDSTRPSTPVEGGTGMKKAPSQRRESLAVGPDGKMLRKVSLAVGPDGKMLRKIQTLNTSFWVPNTDQGSDAIGKARLQAVQMASAMNPVSDDDPEADFFNAPVPAAHAERGPVQESAQAISGGGAGTQLSHQPGSGLKERPRQVSLPGLPDFLRKPPTLHSDAASASEQPVSGGLAKRLPVLPPLRPSAAGALTPEASSSALRPSGLLPALLPLQATDSTASLNGSAPPDMPAPPQPPQPPATAPPAPVPFSQQQGEVAWGSEPGRGSGGDSTQQIPSGKPPRGLASFVAPAASAGVHHHVRRNSEMPDGPTPFASPPAFRPTTAPALDMRRSALKVQFDSQKETGAFETDNTISRQSYAGSLAPSGVASSHPSVSNIGASNPSGTNHHRPLPTRASVAALYPGMSVSGPRLMDLGPEPSPATTERGLASRMASTVVWPGPTSRMASAELEDSPPGLRIKDFLHGRSLFLFSNRSMIRITCAKIVTNPRFEQMMLIVILASSIQLALDNQDLEPGSRLASALYVMDIIFCVVFGVEMIMKMIVMGVFANGPGSYLRSSWNILDAAIVAVQIVVLVVQATIGDSQSWVKAFKALRALRPLRAASRMDGIKIVVISVLKAIPAMGDVVLVGLLFYFIFSVLTVNLFMGGMFACTSTQDGSQLDAYYLLPDGSSINKTWCNQGSIEVNTSYYHSRINQTVPAWNLSTQWVAPQARFDNVAQAILTLFQMASLEGWSDVMYAAQDVVGPEQQPVRGYNAPVAIFFIIFIVVGSFFMLNLIVGVSIDKFNEMKEQAGASPLLTEAQQQWLNIQKLLTATRLSPRWTSPKEKWRRWAYDFTLSNSYFDSAMIVVILANVATMCMVHANQTNEWETALNAANLVFTCIFVMEMLLKWIAVGLGPYFRDDWNKFDAIVVFFSVLGVVLDYTTPQRLAFMTIMRILRVARIFRLIPKARSLRLMLSTLLWSLPALANVAAMLFMFMFMYAIMGMNLFGNIKFQDEITEHANFRSFPTAMLTLFRCITGENWNSLMQECMVLENCIHVGNETPVLLPSGITQVIPSDTYLDPVSDADLIALIPGGSAEDQCSVGPLASVIYFSTYMLLCTYMLLQLVIAVVLENIGNQYEMEGMVIHQNHMWAFVDTWEALDQAGDGFIDVYHLTALLEAVPAPLGVRGLDFAPRRVLDMVMSSDIPLHNNQVHFLQTVHALAGRVAGADLPEQEEWTIHHRLVERLPQDSSGKYNAGHYYAAMYVTAAIKGFLARRMIAPLWDEVEAASDAPQRSSVSRGPSLTRANVLSKEKRETILQGLKFKDPAPASPKAPPAPPLGSR